MKKNVSHIFLSVICFILALGTLVLMILQTLDHVMALPQFIQVFSVRLTAVFLQSSWFLPAYLFFCAFLLLSAERSHPYHVLIPFTAIPFATIVLFLHFTFGNADAALNRWILTMVPDAYRVDHRAVPLHHRGIAVLYLVHELVRARQRDQQQQLRTAAPQQLGA